MTAIDWFRGEIFSTRPIWLGLVPIGLTIWLLGRKRAASVNGPRRAVWNWIAIILQMVALVAGLLALKFFSQPESLIGLLYAIPAYTFLAILGLVAALVAIFRRERWPALSWIALFLNGVPFVIFLHLILQKVHL
jgi:hypothetical protein